MEKHIFAFLFITFVSMNGIDAGSFWSDPLTSLKEEIMATINSSINQLTKNLNETNNQIKNISEQLIIASEDIAQVIYNQVLGLLKKVNDDVNKLIVSNAINGTENNNTDIDLSECKQMSERTILLASVAYANYSYCVVNKIELAGGYSETIRKITNDVISDLDLIKNDANNCTENLGSGIKSKSDAILCLNNVGARVLWMTLNTMVDVSVNVTNFISKMIKLQITLPQCAVTHGIDDLSQEYISVYDKTKKCIDEKKNRQKQLNDL